MTSSLPNLFTKQGGLVEPVALDAIQNGNLPPILLGTDGQLHRYANGIWEPKGDAEVTERLSALLGDQLRIKHVKAIRELMKASYPTFDLLAQPHPDASHLICVANGVVDLRPELSGAAADGPPVLLSHNPDYRFRTQVPHEWNPEAVCPAIDKFLYDCFTDKSVEDEMERHYQALEMSEFLLEWIGYTMLPALQLKLALLLYSPQSDSGKSTTLNLVTALLGTHNVSAISLQALDNDRFQRANLDGKLANIAGDLSAEAAVSSSMFKSLLGGDEVTIERKMVQATKMRNTAKLLFGANSLPPTADQEDAYFRRWHIVHYPNKFGYDPDFAERITQPSELQGLLVKAALAVQRLVRREPVGFADPLPMAVDRATSRYRIEADSVVRWLDDDTIPDTDNRLKRAEVYKRYAEWSKESGHGALSATKFYRRLERMPGIKMGVTSGTRWVEGIRLHFPGDRRPTWAKEL